MSITCELPLMLMPLTQQAAISAQFNVTMCMYWCMCVGVCVLRHSWSLGQTQQTALRMSFYLRFVRFELFGQMKLNSEIINVIDNSLIIFYLNLLSLQATTGNCLGWVFKLKLNWTLPVSVDNCLAHCAYARCSHVECVLHTHLHATNVSLSSLWVCLTIWLSVYLSLSLCLCLYVYSICLAHCN